MLWVVGALSSLLSFAWARGLNVFDVANGLFGSLVAVTGDAHQAQVAQVRAGRSWRTTHGHAPQSGFQQSVKEQKKVQLAQEPKMYLKRRAAPGTKTVCPCRWDSATWASRRTSSSRKSATSGPCARARTSATRTRSS